MNSKPVSSGEEVQQKAEQKDIKGDATATVINVQNANVFLSGDEYKSTAQKFAAEVSKFSPRLLPEVYNPALADREIGEWEQTQGIFTILKTKEGAAETAKELSFTEREKNELRKYSVLFEVFEKMAVLEKKSDISGTLLSNAIRIMCREDIIDALPDNSDEIADKTEEVGRQRNEIDSQFGPNAKKVYNMLRSEDLSQFVIDHWKKLQTERKTEDVAVAKFSLYWHQRLIKHPNKVFISQYQGQSGEDDELVEIMRDYLVMNKAVELFSRGNTLNKLAKKVVDELKQEFDNYVVTQAVGRIAKVRTLKHSFIPKEFFKEEIA